MAPVYRIRNPDATYTDISSYFRLYKLDVATNAEEGSVAQSTITAHDPTGAFDIVGHRQLRIHEDTASGSNTMIYVGFVGDRRISRGPNRTTVGADWEIDLLDPNSILARRILTGSDSNRPAETDVARIQWLVSTNESGMVNDSLYVQTTGPVSMDAKDYTGQRFNEVIDDCAQASGKNYHLWYRESTGTFSLWYDFDNSTSQTSPLRLTNVDTEVDNVLTFAISQDTVLGRSPDRVNSGVYLPYDGGVVYTQNGTTSNSFARRDVVMPAENVTTLAKATARAARYLTEMATEEDVITTTVILPAAKQGFLKEGMRVQIKATHLPGYESYVWARAMNRSVLQVSEENYEVKLELSPSLSACVAPTVVQRNTGAGTAMTAYTLLAAPTVGNRMVVAIGSLESSGARPPDLLAGWTRIRRIDAAAFKFNYRWLEFWTRVVQSGDGTSYAFTRGGGADLYINGAFDIQEWTPSALDVNAATSTTTDTATAVLTPSAVTDTVMLAAGWSVDNDTPAVTALTFAAPLIEQSEQVCGLEGKMGFATASVSPGSAQSLTVTGTGAFSPGDAAQTHILAINLVGSC